MILYEMYRIKKYIYETMSIFLCRYFYSVCPMNVNFCIASLYWNRSMYLFYVLVIIHNQDVKMSVKIHNYFVVCSLLFIR